jgi:hypothetical protein
MHADTSKKGKKGGKGSEKKPKRKATSVETEQSTLVQILEDAKEEVN